MHIINSQYISAEKTVLLYCLYICSNCQCPVIARYSFYIADDPSSGTYVKDPRNLSMLNLKRDISQFSEYLLEPISKRFPKFRSPCLLRGFKEACPNCKHTEFWQEIDDSHSDSTTKPIGVFSSLQEAYNHAVDYLQARKDQSDKLLQDSSFVKKLNNEKRQLSDRITYCKESIERGDTVSRLRELETCISDSYRQYEKMGAFSIEKRTLKKQISQYEDDLFHTRQKWKDEYSALQDEYDHCFSELAKLDAQCAAFVNKITIIETEARIALQLCTSDCKAQTVELKRLPELQIMSASVFERENTEAVNKIILTFQQKQKEDIQHVADTDA